MLLAGERLALDICLPSTSFQLLYIRIQSLGLVSTFYLDLTSHDIPNFGVLNQQWKVTTIVYSPKASTCTAQASGSAIQSHPLQRLACPPVETLGIIRLL